MGSFLLLAILPVIFTSSVVFAEAKQSSLSMSTTTNNLASELAAGTFGKSNSSVVRVSTDNSAGYTLRIFSNEDTSLSNDTDKKIDSISSVISEEAFSTISDHNNKWGYRPSQIVNSISGTPIVSLNSNFLPAPGTLGDMLDITNTSNSEDNVYTLDFGAKVDYNTPPSTYSNTLTLIALANNIEYTINYDKNTTDEVSNMPSPNPQVVTIEGGAPLADSNTRISSTTPTREGFKFYGWCDEATESDSEGYQTCPGHLYKAGDYYSIDQTANSSVNLYAVWVMPVTDITLDHNCPSNSTGSTSTIAEYGTNTLGMIEVPTCADYDQPFRFYFNTNNPESEGAAVTPSSDCDPKNCASTKSVSFSFVGWYDDSPMYQYDISGYTSFGSLVASTDAVPVLRPSTNYTDLYGRWRSYDDNVTLYANWSTSAGSYQSRTLPTIIKDGYTCKWKDPSGQIYNSGASVRPSGAYYSSMTFYGFCTEGVYMQDTSYAQLNTLAPNEGDTVTLVDKRDESDYTVTAGDSYNEARCHDSGNDNNGVWYNYAAATAKTIIGDDNSNDAAEDICPAGWHLPDINTLYDNMGSSYSYYRRFSPVAGGYYHYGSLRYTQYGRWWSTTPEYGDSRYGLQVEIDSSYDGEEYHYSYEYDKDEFDRTDGNYIRCVKMSTDQP